MFEGTFRRNVYMLFHLRLHLLSSEYSSLNLEVYVSITFLHLFLLLNESCTFFLTLIHSFVAIDLSNCFLSVCQPLNTSSMLLSFIMLSVPSHMYFLLYHTLLSSLSLTPPYHRHHRNYHLTLQIS